MRTRHKCQKNVPTCLIDVSKRVKEQLSNGFVNRTNVVVKSMAIFEQERAKKVLLDDTESLSCVIENWRNTNGHTVGYLHLQCSNYPI